MTPENKQVRNHDPSQGRKLVLRKETIKDLRANDPPKNVLAGYPVSEPPCEHNPSELCDPVVAV